LKGLVVYDSSYGNTKKIAETIAQKLSGSGIENNLFKINKVKNLNDGIYDFLVIGSPTKFGSMSFAMKRFLGKVKSNEWASKPFVAFDTELPENIEDSKNKDKDWSAAEKIARKLEEKNLKQIMPVLKALVSGKKGPLVEGEIERTQDYANQLAEQLVGFMGVSK
jgi:menaquinone-dependent protoporphyrinogen IX oxidase